MAATGSGTGSAGAPVAVASRSTTVTFKAPRSLVQAIDATVRRFVLTRRDGGMSRSEFVKRAVARELDHLAQSRRGYRRRPRRRAHPWGAGNTAGAGTGFHVAGRIVYRAWRVVDEGVRSGGACRVVLPPPRQWATGAGLAGPDGGGGHRFRSGPRTAAFGFGGQA